MGFGWLKSTNLWQNKPENVKTRSWFHAGCGFETEICTTLVASKAQELGGTQGTNPWRPEKAWPNMNDMGLGCWKMWEKSGCANEKNTENKLHLHWMLEKSTNIACNCMPGSSKWPWFGAGNEDFEFYFLVVMTSKWLARQWIPSSDHKEPGTGFLHVGL